MILIGRQSRGYSQLELAKLTGLAQPSISRFEKGEVRCGIAELQLIAEALEYPFRFFILPEKRLVHNGTGVFHRHRKSKISDKQLDSIHAKLNILRIQIKRLLHFANMEPAYSLPRYDLRDFGGDPAAVARQLRKDWQIPAGPIPDMVEVLEGAGTIIVNSIFEDGDFSAVAQYVPESGVPPLVFLDVTKPTDHQRFSLAHELGHLVMHHIHSNDVDDQSNTFAGEFLAPEAEIAPSLLLVAIPTLFRLKPYWKMSALAILERAHRLNRITKTRYVSLRNKMRLNGYLINEPSPLSPENPTILRDLFHVCSHDHGFSLQELSEILLMSPDELRKVFGAMVDQFRDEPETDFAKAQSIEHLLETLSPPMRQKALDIINTPLTRMPRK